MRRTRGLFRVPPIAGQRPWVARFRAHATRWAALGIVLLNCAPARASVLTVQAADVAASHTDASGVSLSPTSLTFAAQTVDTTSAPETVTLTNTGSATLTVNSITNSGNYSQTNTCGSSVAAGASCAINVVFTPTSTGTRGGTLVVSDSAGNSPQTAGLTGTGLAQTATLSPSSLSFGSQMVNTKSATKSVKLTNNTGATITIFGITTSGNYSETNTCGTSLAATKVCAIAVMFTPTTTGTVPGTLTITSSYAGSPQTLPIIGTGVAPTAVFAPTSLTFANQAVGTSSPVNSVTLTNSGTAALTISSISVTGTDTTDFSQTNTCGTTLSVNASCSISVTFTPTASGTRAASVSVSDNAAGSPQSVPLTGNGLAPAASLSPSSITFSNQAVGTTSGASPLTLNNTGNAALSITSIMVTGTNNGDFAQSNNCGTSLAAATSCTINVTFTPEASGTRTATVSVMDNASGSPQTATLSGTGTAPMVTFSISTITFASTGLGASSAPGGVTLFNTGNGDLPVSSIAITGANAGDFSQTNNCGVLVTAGSNCTITAVFTPKATGARAAAISVTDGAAGSPQSVALSGTGVSGGPAASISPLSLTFASQNVLTTSPAQPVTLTNTGASAMSLISIVASGDYAQTNNCGTTLATSASCTVQVTFTPSAGGTRAGYVTFSDNDPSTQQTVTITGTGATPTSTVSIVPVQASMTPGQSAQFQAYINGVASSNVTWTVDGTAGGNGSIGTVSSSGLYTAPATAGPHQVAATSTANTTQSATVLVVVTSFAGTFSYHNDNGLTGQNLSETVLNTGNVNSAQFGKIFSYKVDGQLYAEPLYVQGVSIAAGTHNVVYVATENDSVYAFDGDGTVTTPLWQVGLIPTGAQVLADSDVNGCNNILPSIGITGTPVIDPATNTMFLVARSKIVNGGVTTYYQYLHALDITTGAERAGSPVQVQASVASNRGTLIFDPRLQNQRAALFLNNGMVYIAWGSHCDYHPYHGWLMGYQESTLQQTAVFNSTPNGDQGGIWSSGAPPAIDENGYIYASVGNGTTDVNSGGIDYGVALLKLNPGNLSVADYFLPSDYAYLNSNDLDLGSGSPLILPDQPTPPTQLLVAAGKDGSVYLIDRTTLGQYNANGNNVVQVLPVGTVPNAHSMPAYWQNNVYFCGMTDYAKSYLLVNGLLSTSPTSESPTTFGYPGATPVVSANGSTNGVVWLLSTVKNTLALLHAYDAVNLSRELYNSAQNITRDKGGTAVKFAVPTVANGKVYVGTSSELDVYGLLPQP